MEGRILGQEHEPSPLAADPVAGDDLLNFNPL
jgi:hypothetical protein